MNRTPLVQIGLQGWELMWNWKSPFFLAVYCITLVAFSSTYCTYCNSLKLTSRKTKPCHYGSGQPDFETFNHPLSCKLSKLGTEWVSEQANKWAQRSSAREQSEQYGASEWVSGASEWMNGRAKGPVLTSRFVDVLNQSACTISLHE